MQYAKVVGNATSSTKHPSMKGWRLLIVQPLGVNKKPDGDPHLIIDHMGAQAGDLIIMSSDGKAARELVNDKSSPVRWFVLGILDNE